MKITYENICNHRHTVLDLEPGKLIAIVGQTGAGKSAMFYTLLSGFTNSPDFKKFFNNKALKENPKAVSKISIKDDNGGFWQVEASMGHLYYRVDDIKYEAVRRKNIFELSEKQIPGLLYDPENTTEIMNIVDEDTGLFPIDRSDSQIFKTYERLLSLSCTEDILRTIKLDQEDIDFKITDLTSSVQKQQEQLNKLQAFEATLEASGIDVTNSLQELEAHKSKYEHLQSLLDVNTKTAYYVSKVTQYWLDTDEDFDVEQFRVRLDRLIKATRATEYITKVNAVMTDEEQVDLDKVMKVSNAYSRAKIVIKDIEDINLSINEDTKQLDDIQKILDTIKICPYCNRPMEDK